MPDINLRLRVSMPPNRALAQSADPLVRQRYLIKQYGVPPAAAAASLANEVGRAWAERSQQGALVRLKFPGQHGKLAVAENLTDSEERYDFPKAYTMALLGELKFRADEELRSLGIRAAEITGDALGCLNGELLTKVFEAIRAYKNPGQPQEISMEVPSEGLKKDRYSIRALVDMGLSHVTLCITAPEEERAGDMIRKLRSEGVRRITVRLPIGMFSHLEISKADAVSLSFTDTSPVFNELRAAWRHMSGSLTNEGFMANEGSLHSCRHAGEDGVSVVESGHDLEGKPVWGFGAGVESSCQNLLTYNVESPQDYVARAKAGETLTWRICQLPEEEAMSQQVLSMLNHGIIDAALFRQIFGREFRHAFSEARDDCMCAEALWSDQDTYRLHSFERSVHVRAAFLTPWAYAHAMAFA